MDEKGMDKRLKTQVVTFRKSCLSVFLSVYPANGSNSFSEHQADRHHE